MHLQNPCLGEKKTKKYLHSATYTVLRNMDAGSKQRKYRIFIIAANHIYCHVYAAQKMKISTEDFSSFLRIWSHLLKKFLTENFIFCAVIAPQRQSFSVPDVSTFITNAKFWTHQNNIICVFVLNTEKYTTEKYSIWVCFT